MGNMLSPLDIIYRTGAWIWFLAVLFLLYHAHADPVSSESTLGIRYGQDLMQEATGRRPL